MMAEATVGRPLYRWRTKTGFRLGCAGVVSATVHGIFALLLVGILVRSPTESRLIRVLLYDPPPPPPAGDSTGHAPSMATAPAVPETHPVATTSKPVRKAPSHLHRRSAPVKPQSPPAAADVAREASPAVEAGGVSGGVTGGIAGGTVGGTGHTLIAAEQAAHLPVPISKVLPEYPPIARMRGIEGQVLLEAIVSADGHIEPDITVVRSVPLLDTAAIDALRKWLFRPARDAEGIPLRVTLRVPVRFVLR